MTFLNEHRCNKLSENLADVNMTMFLNTRQKVATFRGTYWNAYKTSVEDSATMRSVRSSGNAWIGTQKVMLWLPRFI